MNRFDVTSLSLCITGSCAGQLWGRLLPERIAQQFARAGVKNLIAEEELDKIDGNVVIIRAGAILDAPLIKLLVDRENLALMSEDGEALAVNVPTSQAIEAISFLKGESDKLQGVSIASPDDLDASYWEALRKRETPYALVYDHKNLAAIEWRMFMGTYKGATDFITRHVWPRPAFHVTRWLAPRGITPNMVTSLSAIFTVLAFVFFMKGLFAAGLMSAWAMTFLDTVDGKLARTTLTSSAWGNIFDHGIDLIHPPFWYWAWGAGLAASGHGLETSLHWWALAIIIGGYVLQRIIEGISIAILGIEIHVWRRIDSLFRQITARRNPNLVLLSLGAIIMRPDLGLLAVALWTVLCFVIHLIQLTHALIVRLKTGPLQSWLTKAEDQA